MARKKTTKSAPPSRDDIAAALTGEWSDEQVTQAYAVESAAQRTVVAVPDDWPEALTDALTRRVQAYLDNGSSGRVGRDAPKVRQLEKKFNRVPGTVPAAK